MPISCARDFPDQTFAGDREAHDLAQNNNRKTWSIEIRVITTTSIKIDNFHQKQMQPKFGFTIPERTNFMPYKKLLVFMIVLTLSPPAFAQDTPDQDQEIKQESVTKSGSYAFGVSFMKNMKSQGVPLDLASFFKGMQDVSTDKVALSEEQLQAAFTAFQQAIQQSTQKEAAMAGEKNKKAGEAFLAANGKKEGVNTTASGLQYKVLKSGDGKTPGPTNRVTTHYEGKLISGTIFDSSLKRKMPATFGVNQVIKGWTEALQLMKEGDEWELYIPSTLAYGERGTGEDIGPNSTLIFYIQLIKVE